MRFVLPKLARIQSVIISDNSIVIFCQFANKAFKSVFHSVYNTSIFLIVILMRPERGKKANEENIFNLVAPDAKEIVKDRLHKSKFPGTLPPTGSTFGLHSTSAKVA